MNKINENVNYDTHTNSSCPKYITTSVIDNEQAYFWTKEWQEGEKEVDEDIKKGRISKKYDNAEDLIRDLNN